MPADWLAWSITGTGADDGRFSINPGNGQLSFLAAPNFELPGDANLDNVYEVRVRVADSGGAADEQTVLITIANANDDPTAGADSFVVNGDETLDAALPGVLAGDGDEDGDALTVSLVSGTSNGTLTLNADGSVA